MGMGGMVTFIPVPDFSHLNDPPEYPSKETVVWTPGVGLPSCSLFPVGQSRRMAYTAVPLVPGLEVYLDGDYIHLINIMSM